VALPRSPEEAAVVERFVDALHHRDLDRVIRLLADDARLTMPPEPVECRGPEAIAAFLGERRFWGPELKLVPTRANGQPALGYYLPDPMSPIWRLNGLMVLTVSDDRVLGLTRFGDTATLARFGLPRTLDAG
jgi:RNA polymerase sigma-70 factor (ECF subfamily)